MAPRGAWTTGFAWLVAASFIGLCALGAIGAILPDAAPEPVAAAPSGPASPQPPEPSPTPSPKPSPTPKPKPLKKAVVLLFLADLKDGDSFVATNGKEYRLGLVNTPETNEPCGTAAKNFTRMFLSKGFFAKAYATDTHGRHVAEVFSRGGKSLNVALAKTGLGNDRYFAEFRHENPDLARRLDHWFAHARTPACLQSSLTPLPLVQQPSGSCHPNYSPCLPKVDDLDCGEIGKPVRVLGADPYRLDADGDGVGCD